MNFSVEQIIAILGATFVALTGAISTLFWAWKTAVERSEAKAWELVADLRRDGAETTKVMERQAEATAAAAGLIARLTDTVEKLRDDLLRQVRGQR